ncbi:hypothetical protein BDR26DRAFT_110662 [Obelidium mucronatum]|nr:hypothetical protein BDR26DRAFT_110662 [Obelidium mucronatum]
MWTIMLLFLFLVSDGMASIPFPINILACPSSSLLAGVARLARRVFPASVSARAVASNLSIKPIEGIFTSGRMLSLSA